MEIIKRILTGSDEEESVDTSATAPPPAPYPDPPYGERQDMLAGPNPETVFDSYDEF